MTQCQLCNLPIPPFAVPLCTTCGRLLLWGWAGGCAMPVNADAKADRTDSGGLPGIPLADAPNASDARVAWLQQRLRQIAKDRQKSKPG